jgi:Transposase DDE domain
MESNTDLSEPEQRMLAAWKEPEWQEQLLRQAADIEQLARASGALVRARNLPDGLTLLRLLLVYVVCDWSLRLVGAWAAIQGIAFLSDVALLYRFRQSQGLVGLLVVRVLQQRLPALRQMAGLHVRIHDAMVISQPGSQGTDWRMHTSLDLGALCLAGVQLSDAHTGESLAHFPGQPEEIDLGDRGYAHARGLGARLAAGARLVVRTNWHNLPLKTDLGQRWSLIHWLQTLTQTRERPVILSTPQGDFRLRLIARPLPPAEAQKARERVSKQARKKGKKVSPDTLLAAGFVLLLTNLPAHTGEAARVAWLYRLRWQVELYFKRLKSLLQFDQLRAKDPRLVQTYLLGKLLAALLLDQLLQATEEQQPDWFAAPQRPVSLWRLSALLWAGLRDLLVGRFSLARILAALPYLRRYLCDPPRHRAQQLAWARHVLRRFQSALSPWEGHHAGNSLF